MRATIPLVILLVTGAFLLPALAAGPNEKLWNGPGIVVSSFNLQTQQITVVDSGAVVCRTGPGAAGAGGNCLPFAAISGAANAIQVKENCAGVCVANVITFQVCVDNNGDGICKGLQDISDDVPMNQPFDCDYDSIFYSHSTTTTKNRDPLFIPPWAQTYWQGCGSKGYPGYVVIICAGAHNNKDNTMPHSHTATTGVIVPTTTTDQTSGNYCGAPTATKAYVVV